jgi:hypothetical protein
VRSTLVAVIAAAALALALAATAAAHVSPSLRENNRHILLAPLGDRVRLVYTVFMGEEPGGLARARMDVNRDGRLDDGEADAFGRQLAAQVAPQLTAEVDGQARAIEWSEVDVGLGEPVRRAGSFAVDLVAWLCLDDPRGRTGHRVRLRDRFHVPDPGETELRAEESPGVRITRSEMSGSEARAMVRLDFRWRGAVGPIETDGYRLDFEVDPALATFAGGACSATADEARGRSIAWVLAGAAIALAGGGALWRRRRAHRGQKMNG